MKTPALIGASVAGLAVVAATLSVNAMVGSAKDRLEHPKEAVIEKVAVADNTEAPYCTPAFKEVLQRVLNACGLVGSAERRGCQPADVKTFASISDVE